MQWTEQLYLSLDVDYTYRAASLDVDYMTINQQLYFFPEKTDLSHDQYFYGGLSPFTYMFK